MRRSISAQKLNQDARVLLRIAPDVRSLVVANLDGAGSVTFTLRGGTNCSKVVTQLEPWVFERRQGEYLHTVDSANRFASW